MRRRTGAVGRAAKKLRILFVDDDVQVVAALKGGLQEMRRAWEMVFLKSGAAALAEMEKKPFEVLVVGLGMAGLSGEDLLLQARERHPETSRIALAGHADASSIARAIPLAHQFISKVCNADVLRAAVWRAGNARSRLDDEEMLAVVGKLDRLPFAPAIYGQLTRAMRDPEVGVSTIAPIVEQDPAMCARLFQMVNSSYCGRASSIVSIDAAVVQLGLQQLRALALAAQIFLALEEGSDPKLLERMQLDAVLTARLARRMAANERLADQAFTAALVHDLGQMLVARAFREAHRAVFEEARCSERNSAELERATIGTTHAHLGAHFLGAWGLPQAVVDAVALHQEPHLFESASPKLTAILHTAAAFVDAALEGRSVVEAKFNEPFLLQSGMQSELGRWSGIAIEELKTVRSPRRIGACESAADWQSL